MFQAATQNCEPKFSVCCSNKTSYENDVLAGHPLGRPLILSAVRDLALLAARKKLENNFLAAIQARLPVILGGRKDQPVPWQNFIRSALGKDLIASIRIHFQRRSLALVDFSRDLDAHAGISSGEVCLRAHRRAANEQGRGADNKYLCCVVQRAVVIFHSGPQIPSSSGPEGLRKHPERQHGGTMQALCHKGNQLTR